MFISSPAPSWQKNLCIHLLALSGITIRGERGAQLQGVNQGSPSVLVGGRRGTERALKTARKRQRVPPRSTAGLTLVQARAISPRAPSDRRALPGRRQRTPGPHRPAPHLGAEQPRMCAPFAATAGSGEARARWPLGTADGRRGAPGSGHGHGSTAGGPGPRPAGGRDLAASPRTSWHRGAPSSRGGSCRRAACAEMNRGPIPLLLKSGRTG